MPGPLSCELCGKAFTSVNQYRRLPGRRGPRVRCRRCPTEAPSHKVCGWCGVDKPASEFYRKRPGSPWRSTYCKPCHNRYTELTENKERKRTTDRRQSARRKARRRMAGENRRSSLAAHVRDLLAVGYSRNALAVRLGTNSVRIADWAAGAKVPKPITVAKVFSAYPALMAEKGVAP